MFTICHCENCNTNFEILIDIEDVNNISKIVCPICKSQNWKRIAM